MVLVYKETHDLRWIIVNMMIYFLFVLGPFYLTLRLIKRTSINFAIRLAFILFVITGIFGALALNQISYFFLVFSFIRGMAEGVYWASANLIELNGLESNSRTKYYSFTSGFNQLLFIILPILLGTFLFNTDYYQVIFFAFSAVTLIGVFIPWNISNIAVTEIKKENVLRIMKNKNFSKYAILKATSAVWWMSTWLIASIIPYVILGDEQNMGIYLSIASVVSALIAFITTKIKLDKKKLFGYAGLVLQTIAYILLAFNLTPVVLYLHSLVDSLTDPIITPSESDFFVKSTEKVQISRSFGSEINIIQETIYTITRMVFGTTCIALLSLNINLSSVLAVFILIVALIRFLQYFFYDRFTINQK
jgi:hypothetical protein